jgi:hypothetical protein
MVVRVDPPGSEAAARSNISADRGVLARYASMSVPVTPG